MLYKYRHITPAKSGVVNYCKLWHLYDIFLLDDMSKKSLLLNNKNFIQQKK